jgi:hypothetical protein
MWQLMHMSGQGYTLGVSSPEKEPFVPMGSRVDPRASFDGAEERKISAHASSRAHNPWSSNLELSHYF